MKMLFKLCLICFIIVFLFGCDITTQRLDKRDTYYYIKSVDLTIIDEEIRGKYCVELKPESQNYLSNCFFSTIIYTDEKIIPGDKLKLVKVNKNE